MNFVTYIQLLMLVSLTTVNLALALFPFFK